jgi:hypothetical protein
MFKLRIPYSVLAFAIAYFSTYTISLSAVIAGTVELAAALALFIRLVSVQHFNYHSFYGSILKQYTILDEIGVGVIWTLVCLRLIAFLFIGMGLWYIGAPLFTLTCMHYIPD